MKNGAIVSFAEGSLGRKLLGLAVLSLICSVANTPALADPTVPAVKIPGTNDQMKHPPDVVTASAVKLPQTIEISLPSLRKKSEVDAKVADEGGKQQVFKGVPLRVLVKEVIPVIDTMKEWKQLARQKILLEVTSADGFAALISVVEVATNVKGDRFMLATEMDGKPLEGVRLVCPNDEHRTRWVRDVNKIRLLRVD